MQISPSSGDFRLQVFLCGIICEQQIDDSASSKMWHLAFNIVRVHVNNPHDWSYNSLAVHANNVIHGDLTGVSSTLLTSLRFIQMSTSAECTH
jgi:hypothetical protein